MDPKLKDDYDWDQEYPNYHHWQTQNMINDGTTFELPSAFTIKDDIIEVHGLHPNHRFLYEFIWKHQPQSVFEVGCGYCNHLLSISRLLPEVECHGCDISMAQLAGAQRRYGAEVANFHLMLGDFIDLEIDFKVDIAYSQAVLMHMSTERAKKALVRMCRTATKFVVSIDGGLIVPNLEKYIRGIPGVADVTFLEDFAKEHWETYVVPPFIIELC